MLSDPISDMLTRIRNAVSTHKESVDVPASKFKEQIAHILNREGYVGAVERVKLESGFDVIRIALKYGAKRVTSDNLPRIHSGMGIAIVSTSKGLLVDREARKAGVGGEIICEVW
jgi:small subunit ribosomal protein S8